MIKTMKQLFTLAAVAVCAVGVWGCVGEAYYPPGRPVAYMFPSVMSGRSLSLLRARPTTPAELSLRLEAMGLLAELRQAGMVDNELAILARGLGRRGYGELDCRRAEGSMRVVVFYSRDGKELAIEALRR